MSALWWRDRESHKKNGWVHPLGTMKVCTKFNGLDVVCFFVFLFKQRKASCFPISSLYARLTVLALAS